MFADSFLHHRTRLESALTDLHTLAAECGAGSAGTPDLEKLIEPLHEACFFTVAGATGSGKSTLLAALFAAPVFESEQSTPAALHRHGKAAKRSAAKGGVVEVTHAGNFPRDFHLAEWDHTTPARTAEKEWLERTEALLYCLPLTKPWEPAAWSWLEALPPDVRRKTVLVLPFRDLRTPGEVEAVVEHARSLARSKWGTNAPEMFPVSSTAGLLARTSAADPAGLLAASGLPEPEAALIKLLNAGPKRLSAATAARDAGWALAEKIRAALRITSLAVEEGAARHAESVSSRKAERENRLAAAAALGVEAEAKWAEISAGAEVRFPAFPRLLVRPERNPRAPEEAAGEQLATWLREKGAGESVPDALRRITAGAGLTELFKKAAAEQHRTALVFTALFLLSAGAALTAWMGGALPLQAFVPAGMIALPSLLIAWLFPRRIAAEAADAWRKLAASAAPATGRATTLAATESSESAEPGEYPVSPPDMAALARKHTERLEELIRVLNGGGG